MAGILLDTPDRTDELVALVSGGFDVAVVYGEHDDAWGPQMQNAVADRLGVRPVVVAGTGHSPAAESPAETARALDAVLGGFAGAAHG
jgi:pimeloyl-ACP methyl ester carboxylesterase